MSVESLALSLGGLVIGYKLHETTGALDDFGTNSLDATIGTRGAYGGTAVLTGSPRAVTASGGAGTGVVASRAHNAALQVANITVGAFVRLSAVAPTGTRGFLGERSTNWQARITTTRLLQVYLTLGGVLQSGSPAASITALAAGERAWVWFSYDGAFLKVGINDGIEADVPLAGSFNSVTDTLNIGAVSNNSMDGEVEHWLMFNRALEIGEHRAIVREGDTTLDRPVVSNEGSILFDLTGDDSPPVAASAQDALCGGCGGRMRLAQGGVDSSAGEDFHDGCRRTQQTGVTGTINSSSTQAAYAGRVDRLIRACLDMVIRRATTSKTTYWDGTQWVVGGSSTFAPQNYVGAGLAAATLARYLKTSRTDPLNRIAIKAGEAIFTHEDDEPEWWGAGDFTFGAVGKMLVMLEGRMDPVQHADWVARLTLGQRAWLDGGLDSVGGSHGAGKAGSWYSNGNRQIPTGVWAIYRLTGDSAWGTTYEQEVAWLNAPTTGGWSPGGNLPHGWVEAVTHTLDDGSDGQGWWREAHNSTSQGFYNVAQTVNVDGEDKGYIGLQIRYGLHLALMTGEQRWYRYVNMLRNRLRLYLASTTTGVVTGAGGSRTSSDIIWTFAVDQALTWKGKRAVGAISTTDMANLFLATEAQYKSLARAPDFAGAFHRDFAQDLCSYLMALDTWPGH